MNKKGFSSVGLLLFITTLIVFLIFPVTAFTIEKSIIYFAVENISDSIDSSMYSIVSDIDIESLSEEKKDFIEEEFRNKFNYMIKKNLLKSTGFKDGDEGIIKSVSIKKIEFIDDNNLDEEYINCYVVFFYRPTLYRSFFEKGNEKQLSFKRKIEIPDNN